MLQAKLTIMGKVQGVFFRSEAQKKAEQLGVSGWVKNNSDGTVSALAQGHQEALQEFVSWCQEGPPLASVKDIDIAFEPIDEKFEGFYIK